MKRDCYRRISGKEKLFLALELADLILLMLALMTLLVSTGSLLVTLPVVVGVYFLIRIFKKNKPHGYTERLALFLTRPRYFTLPGEDRGEVKGT